jgi:hypothetical protein
VTLGGLTKDLTAWEKIFFHQATLMRMWRYSVIKLFRETPNLVIPPNIQTQLNSAFTFTDVLNQLYQKPWIVHCSKPSEDYKKNVNYLGRYAKRPAIAESKLKHYDGHEVAFKYLDHTTKTYRQSVLTVEEFIGRFVQHIPDSDFRMIRYYGFLANRVRGKYLPLVYQLLGQEKKHSQRPPTFSELIQKDFKYNPLVCILYGQKLV